MFASDKMLAYAREQIGEPYVFGHSGPDEWDCSGLTKSVVRLLGYIWYHGATQQWLRGFMIKTPTTWYGYWSDSGPIDTLPRNKFAFLFNQDKTVTSRVVMSHTGLYDGRGRVVQAGGYGGKGVHENPFDERRFTHWATLKGAENIMDGIGLGQIGVPVKTLQNTLVGLGYDLGSFGADGNFGAKTLAAVKKFQIDHKLPVTGVWTDAERAALPVEPIVDVLGALTKMDNLLVQMKALVDMVRSAK
jgi:hypothetical protein